MPKLKNSYPDIPTDQCLLHPEPIRQKVASSLVIYAVYLEYIDTYNPVESAIQL